MATTYTSTVQIKCWKEHTCTACGAVYAYQFVRKVGRQAGSPHAATLKAEAAARKKLVQDADMRPCPTCGLLQPDMVGQRRARRFWFAFWLTLPPCLIILLLRGTDAVQSDTATWLVAAVSALGAAALWWIELYDPNRDLARNQRQAAEAVAAGVVRHQPGRVAPGMAAMIPPLKPVGPRLVLVLLVLAVALAGAPEVMRSVRGWPLNHDCYPPVVGPGDHTRIYMTDKIRSLKGFWRGQAVVTALVDGESGKSVAIPATTNQKDWGHTIKAESGELRNSATPWVRLSLPDDPGLAGKKLTCAINLKVQWPEEVGGNTFREQSSTLRRTVTVQTATPGAGAAYNLVGWGATLGAMGLVLACAAALARMAKALRRTARPTRTYVDDPAQGRIAAGV